MALSVLQAYVLLPSHQGLATGPHECPEWPSERKLPSTLSFISLPQLSLLTLLPLSLAFPGSRACPIQTSHLCLLSLLLTLFPLPGTLLLPW